MAQLYAVLDGAADPKVHAAVVASGYPHACLYHGEIPDDLKAAAPWLVALEGRSSLAALLGGEGKGKSWGILLECQENLEKLSRHLRQFLRARDERGKFYAFRFYDPRILRVYLPSCRRNELESFFGPVSRFWIEDKNGALVEYSLAGWKLVRKTESGELLSPPLFTDEPAEPARELDARTRETVAMVWRPRPPWPGTPQIYAVLDGARDSRIVPAVFASKCLCACLYHGNIAPDLREAAPWLVLLSPETPLNRLLLGEGRGKSWGILLEAGGDLKAVERHLRKFLVVKNEKKKRLAFRFYDPRVLRRFLPTCRRNELATFFGDVLRFYAEDEKGALIELSLENGALVRRNEERRRVLEQFTTGELHAEVKRRKAGAPSAETSRTGP